MRKRLIESCYTCGQPFGQASYRKRLRSIINHIRWYGCRFWGPI